MKLSMKNTKQELYSALQSSTDTVEERNILAWLSIILFAHAMIL